MSNKGKVKDKHLLIDGYNIIYAWPDLKHMLPKNIDAACAQLADTVRVIHDTGNLRLTLVFDGKGRMIEVIRPTGEPTFSLLYTPKGMTADTLIGQLTANPKKNQEIFVASQDSPLCQICAQKGAIILSPDALLDWVNTCKKTQTLDIGQRKKLADQQWKENKSPWNPL